MRLKRCLLCMLLGAALILPTYVFAEKSEPLQACAKVDFNDHGKKTGLSLLWFELVEVEREGRKGVVLNHDNEAKRYLYIDVNDNMLYDIPDDTPIEVTVDYFDEGEGFFELAYDSYGISENIRDGIWGYEDAIKLENTKEWKTHTFYVERMRMANRLGGYDVRIGIWSIPSGPSPDQVIIGKVTIQTSERKNQLRLESISGSKEGNIYAKGEKISVALNIANKSDRDAEGGFVYTASDENGHKVCEGKVSGSFPAGKVTPLIIKPTADKYGIYNLSVEGEFKYSDGKDKAKIPFAVNTEYSLAWEVTKENINDNYGTALLINSYDWSAPNGVAAGIAARAGMRWNREEIQWSRSELSPGVYKIPDEQRREIELAHEAGMYTELGLMYSNPIHYGSDYAGTVDAPTTESELEAYGKWCEWLARETKGIVQAFAIWNEYNGSFNAQGETPEHYVKIMEVAYNAVKRGNPEAIVIGLETAQIDPAFNKRVFEAGGLKYMDVAGVHPYDWSGHFDTQKIINMSKDMQALMREYGDEKPIWWTEFGFSSHYSMRERMGNYVMAYALQECYDLAETTFQFRMQDDLEAGEIEGNWGVLRTPRDSDVNNCAKPAYLSICAMNNLIGAAAEAKEVIQEDTTYAFHFYNKAMQKDVVLLQSEYDAQFMTLDLGAGQAEVYDAYGNKLETLISENGVFSLGINTDPIYLTGNFSKFERVDNSQAVLIPGNMVDTVIPGEAISFTMRNNTGKKVRIVAEENDFISIEKSEEQKDGTIKVTLRTSKEMKEDIRLKLKVFNENGEMIYRDTAVAQMCPEPIDVVITSEQTAKGSDHWRARVEITNLSNENSISGTITVTAPEDKAKFIKPRTFSSLSPREAVTIYLNLPDAATKTNYELQMNLALNNGYKTDISKQLDFTSAKYAEKKPTIDGKWDKGEWDGIWFGSYDAKHYGTDKYSGNKVWNGPDDSSFSALAMWDEENLYMLLCAKDNAHYIKYDGGPMYMWSADCIQFGIDDRVEGLANGDRAYTEIGVGDVPDFGSAVVRYSSYYGLPTWVVIENSKAAVKRSGKYTIYEFAIPWTELINKDFVPHANQKLKFAALLNDVDTGSRGWLTYNGDLANNKDVNTFGIMTLEK